MRFHLDRILFGSLALLLTIAAAATGTDQPASAVGSVMKLLQSGKVPSERLPPIVEIICARGNAHDLAYVYQRALEPEGFSDELRVVVLQNLAEAAVNRQVRPAGELSGIADLLRSEEDALRQAAVELSGIWQVRGAVEPLQSLAVHPETSDDERAAALQALLDIDSDAARASADALAQPQQPFALQATGIQALAAIDVADAARRAAEALQQAAGTDDPGPILDAFLARQGGSDALAAALEDRPPTEDVAKLALRRMYGAGRSDAALSAILERAARVQGEIAAPKGAELAALIAEIQAHGDPDRGEAVFRRADLSCMKCHAVSQAGGQIGPDLSAVGASSPMDYLITSLYDPDAQIKEAYLSRIVLTADGLTIQGIVVDRTGDRLVLKDADGVRREIPLAEIDEEIEGKSLMPKGLVKFMTRSEVVDLLAFLSQLGRPGKYAVRATPRMQRWRVLGNVSEELAADIPNDTTFEDRVLLSSGWVPVYARVDGSLPLNELVDRVGSAVLYLQGEFDVTSGGPVGIRIEAPARPAIWVDDVSFSSDSELVVSLEPGRHQVTLRVDAGSESEGSVRLELFRPSGSQAEFAVVDGQ